MVSFAIGGWALIGLSLYAGLWKGEREWQYRYFLLAQLNWILYYLSMGKP